MIGSPFERTRPEDCLSDFALDRLVGEREAVPHLSTCAGCAERYREMEAARDRFDMPPAPSRLHSLRALPARSRWHTGLALATAACVAGLIFWPIDREGYRLKSGPRLSFYVKHEEHVRKGSDGDKVAPKDSIRFAYSAEKPYHLAVLSIDPNGAISVYYPEGERTRPEMPGAEVALFLSTLLDESVGAERIFALFCESPIDLEAAKSALRSGAISRAGCVADRIDWVKAP